MVYEYPRAQTSHPAVPIAPYQQAGSHPLRHQHVHLLRQHHVFHLLLKHGDDISKAVLHDQLPRVLGHLTGLHRKHLHGTETPSMCASAPYHGQPSTLPEPKSPAESEPVSEKGKAACWTAASGWPPCPPGGAPGGPASHPDSTFCQNAGMGLHAGGQSPCTHVGCPPQLVTNRGSKKSWMLRLGSGRIGTRAVTALQLHLWAPSTCLRATERGTSARLRRALNGRGPEPSGSPREWSTLTLAGSHLGREDTVTPGWQSTQAAQPWHVSNITEVNISQKHPTSFSSLSCPIPLCAVCDSSNPQHGLWRAQPSETRCRFH